MDQTSARSSLPAKKFAAMACLGFASGLPLALTGGTLQAWMKDLNVDLATIGLFGLTTAPYFLKFLWSPLMDRYVPPLLGRRRGWLLVTQMLLMLATIVMAVVGASNLTLLAVVAVAIAFFSASQDIVSDAYRTDVLLKPERGAGAAIFVAGYRVAMLASGAGALILVGQNWIGWPTAYALMAATMLIGVIGTIIAPEPQVPPAPPTSIHDAVVPPFKDLLSRHAGWAILLFVMLFRLPDVIGGAMTIPFLRVIGVSNTQIGVIRNGIGVGVTIVGALIGGHLINRLGLARSLWAFAILGGASNLTFYTLARTGNHPGVLMGAVVVENLCGGLAVAGLFVFLMNQCNGRFSATQYALLSSVMAFSGTIVGSQAGIWARSLGWENFFIVSALAALPGIALIPWLPLAPETTGDTRATEIAVDSSL